MTACAGCGLGRKIEVPDKKYDRCDERLTLHCQQCYGVANTADQTVAMQRLETVALNPLPQSNGANLGKKRASSTRKSLMALSSRG
jgi:hypothetical protein